MNLSPSVLADSDNIGLIVGVIIFLLTWGFSAFANLAKRQKEQAERGRLAMERAMRERMQAAASLGQMSGSSQQAPPPGPPPGGWQPQYQQQAQLPPRGPAVPPMRSPELLERRPGPPKYAPRNAGVTSPPPVRRPPQVPPPRAKGPVVPARRSKKVARRQAPAVPAAAPVMFLDEASEGPARPGVTESEIGAGSVAASPSRRAAAAGPMIRVTPQSLRQQFILTEILQPPLALRGDRGI